MSYDFKAAESRIAELGLIYLGMKDKRPEDGTWDWWIKGEIEEIGQEMVDAVKSKIAVGQDGYQDHAVLNIFASIIPVWQISSKEVMQSGSL